MTTRTEAKPSRAGRSGRSSGAAARKAATPPPATGWRSILKVHPAAEMFPRVSREELEALGQNIRENGLITAVALIWRGNSKHNPRIDEVELLDGISRLDALEAVGYRLVGLSRVYGRLSFDRNPGNAGYQIVYPADPFAYVVAANIHRRHLDGKQKRELVAKLLKQKPERSDRATAKLAGVDHKTSADERAKLERRGEIPHVETKTDTKGRRQPSRRSRKKQQTAHQPAEPTNPAQQPIDARARHTVKAGSEGNALPLDQPETQQPARKQQPIKPAPSQPAAPEAPIAAAPLTISMLPVAAAIQLIELLGNRSVLWKAEVARQILVLLGEPADEPPAPDEPEPPAPNGGGGGGGAGEHHNESDATPVDEPAARLPAGAGIAAASVEGEAKSTAVEPARRGRRKKRADRQTR